MVDRLADIFEDLEIELIKNQKKIFKSYPNKSMKSISDYASNMRSKQNMLEKLNIRAINRAYSLANSYLDKSIEESYNTGISNVEKQVKKEIEDKSLNERGQALKENALQVISRICRIAISSTIASYVNIVSSLSSYKNALDIYSAIDLAQASILEKGVIGSINSNGAQMNIVTFGDVIESEYKHAAILTGEGKARDETGQFYVAVSSHFGCCEKCAKWEDVIVIDDMNARGRPDGIHPLLSQAVKDGLFHPNCRHRTRIILNGEEKNLKVQSTKDWTEKQNHSQYQAQQKQRYIERQIREYKRREVGSMTDAEVLKAKNKKLEWQARQREHIKASNKLEGVQLFRRYEREQISVDTRPKMSLELKERSIILKSYLDSENKNNKYLIRGAENIKPHMGYNDVVIHGTENGFNDGTKDLTIKELADILRNDNGVDLKHGIRLFACGSGNPNYNIAQELSNELKCLVLAPTRDVWLAPNGEFSVGENNEGAWILYKPKGDKK